MTELKTNEDITPADTDAMLAGSYIVTVDDYDTYSNPRLVDRSVFSKYAFKNGRFSDSAQIDEKEYGVEFKTPQYPLDFLAGLLNMNTYHEECCDLVSMYTTKYGYDIEIATGADLEDGNAVREEVFNWLNTMPVSLIGEINLLAYDFEAIGCCGIEKILSPDAPHELQYYKHFDILNCKLTTDGKKVVQEVGGKRRYFLLESYNLMHPDDPAEINKYDGTIHPKGTLSRDLVGNEVIWIRKYKTGMDNYGSSKISKALDVIETEVGRANFIKKFFVNYGLPAFVVTVTGNFKQYEQNRYNADGTINDDFDETKTLEYEIGQKLKKMILNPYSAMVLTLPSDSQFGNEVKVEITPLNNDVKEASFRLLREDNKKEVCDAHGISSDLIGTTQVGSLGGNTLETDLNSFVNDKIRPIQILIENAITPSIRERFGTDIIQYRLNNSRAEDKDKKLDRILKLGNAGLMTRREQQLALGSEFGITTDSDNEYLDLYLINGRTEEMLFDYGIYAGNRYNNYSNQVIDENQFSNKTLNSIESDLIEEAYKMWCENGKDGTISLKSEAKERIPKNVQTIIRKHFKQRGNTNK